MNDEFKHKYQKYKYKYLQQHGGYQFKVESNNKMFNEIKAYLIKKNNTCVFTRASECVAVCKDKDEFGSTDCAWYESYDITYNPGILAAKKNIKDTEKYGKGTLYQYEDKNITNDWFQIEFTSNKKDKKGNTIASTKGDMININRIIKYSPDKNDKDKNNITSITFEVVDSTAAKKTDKKIRLFSNMPNDWLNKIMAFITSDTKNQASDIKDEDEGNLYKN